MSWTWVRPADPSLLDGRPLLDLGTGDGQTLNALAPSGLVIGIDRDPTLLRRGSVNAEAHRLPIASKTIETVLAADLFHHLADPSLARAMQEVARVLAASGRLVAWWYETPGRPAPDAPRHPRAYEAVAAAALEAGFGSVGPLELTTTMASGPPTVGLLATL